MEGVITNVSVSEPFGRKGTVTVRFEVTFEGAGAAVEMAKPPRPLTAVERAEFARHFPLVEGRGVPVPPSNPNHHGQPVPAEHEPPITMAQMGVRK